MAQWKKIIVSGSNVDLNEITGSTLQLTGLPNDSSNQNPLVIDASGNVSTGSAYALAAGGNTVGGSNLTSNVAIVGDGDSLIKSASSTNDVDFNSADVYGVVNLTASNALISNTLSLSNKKAFKVTSNELELTGSELTSFKVETPVTMSNVPEAGFTDFYLGVSSSGEVVKIDKSSVGGGSGGSIVKEGTNIDITGASGDIQLYDLGNAFFRENNSITGSQTFTKLYDAITSNPPDITVGDEVVLTNSGGDKKTVVIDELSTFTNVNGNFGALKPTTDITDFGLNLIKVDLKISSPSVATVNLDNDISLTSVTASAGLFFSSSGAGPKNYKIDYAKVPDGNGGLVSDSGSLHITASGLKVEGDLDADGNINLSGSLSFNSFTFTENSTTTRAGSTTTGDELTNTHQFTGSVLITGSNLTLTDGTITAGGFSGDGSELTNLSPSQVNIQNLTDGAGIIDFTYNGQSDVTVGIELDNTSGETLEVGSDGLKIKAGGVDTDQLAAGAVTNAKIEDDAVTAAKLNPNVISSQTSLETVADGNTLLIDDGGSLKKATLTTLKTYIQDGFTTSNLFGDTNTNTSYALSLGAASSNETTLTLGATNLDNTSGTSTTVKFSGTDNQIDLSTSGTPGSDGDVTIGLPNNTTFPQDLTITNDLTIGGNLTVNGDTVTLNTQELHIEDRFIVIGAGTSGTNTDVGIIFDNGTVDGIGTTLFYDDSKDRLAVAKSLSNASIGTTADVGDGGGGQGELAGDIVTVTAESTVDSSTSAEFGQGEIKIDDNGDIWMYLD
jgi:hypothetical protein